MHPWLLYGETLVVPTYLTAILVGATLATFVLARELRLTALPRRAVWDTALVALPGGFVGARLMLILDDPGRLLRDPWGLLLSGGWVFWGALLGGTAAVIAVAAWRGLDPWRVADLYAPAVPFGMIFGRLGCLGAGCCHGRPADWPLGAPVPWSVTYTRLGHVPETLLAVPLHPSPLYESALALGLFVVTTRVLRQARIPGAAFLTLLGGYAAGRFVLEVFRGDLERSFVLGGWLSSAQLTSLVALGVSAWLWRRREVACTPS